MKLITWHFQSMKISMIKMPTGELLCTSAGLCSALGLTAGGLRKLVHDNRSQLHVECVTDRNGLDVFLSEHRAELGLKIIKSCAARCAPCFVPGTW